MNIRTLLGVIALLTATPAAADWLSKVDQQLLDPLAPDRPHELIIELRDRADLTLGLPDRPVIERRREVIRRLREVADRSQQPLRALLDARGIEYRSYWISNAIALKAARTDIEMLARRSDVQHLHWLRPAVFPLPGQADKSLAKAEAMIEPSLTLMRVPEVWALGYRGQGVVVGDHDIGVEWEHPALKTHYRGWDAATQTADHKYNWHNAVSSTLLVDPFCTEAEVPCDSHGHGTHTTGTMVGDDGAGMQIGLAPDAKWMACRSLIDPAVGVGTMPTYLDCMQWTIAPYPSGDEAAADPAMAPDVVSNSWGCIEGCAPPLLKDANDATYAAGIVQVVSAGNDGNGGQVCSTLAFPLAIYESSFTVGATDNSDEMAGFSSRGPVLSDLSLRTKPNVVAPGVGTLSSVTGGGYEQYSGTSMSGPHVAGLVALVMSAEPRLIGRVADVRQLIEQTAVPIAAAKICGGDADAIPNSTFGHGRADALAAVQGLPKLTLEIGVPDTAGTDYSATLTVGLAETAKLAATGLLLKLRLPTGLSAGDAAATSAPMADGGTELQFTHEALQPGEQWVLPLTLHADRNGDYVLDATVEADQVSPLNDSAKTRVGGGSDGSAATGRDAGRFGGGALGLVTVLCGLVAARLRRRPRMQ